MPWPGSRLRAPLIRTRARPITIVAQTNPQLIKRLLPVTARVAAGEVRVAGDVAGAAELLGELVGDGD